LRNRHAYIVESVLSSHGATTTAIIPFFAMTK
jgi:hypothetical protein